MDTHQEGPLFDDDSSLDGIHEGFAGLLGSHEVMVAEGSNRLDITTMTLESFVVWLRGLTPETSAMADALPPETLRELFDAMFVAMLAKPTS